MNCIACSNIMFITRYKDYDDRYVMRLTCSVCRVIREQVIAKSVMGFQLQN